MSEPSRGVWRMRAWRVILGGAPPFVSAVFGILRNKWLALHLETVGLGVLAQVVAGQTWLGTLTSLGLGFPLARAIGAHVARHDRDGIRREVWTVLSLLAVAAAVVAGAILLFAPQISILLLGTPEHAGLVRLGAIGVVGLAFQGAMQGFFAGHSDLAGPLAMALGGGLVALVVTVALVPSRGLAGGMWGAAILFPAAILSAALLHRRRYASAVVPRPRPAFDRTVARALLAVSITGLVLALVDQGSLLVLRAHFLRRNGEAANGLLQAALALSQQVGALFYAYLASYAFGKISGAAGAAGIAAYTRRHWSPLMLAAAACFALAMVGATPLLHLLYTDRFDAAGPMMAWTLVGEFGKVAGQVWALGALPLGGTRLWFPIGLSFGPALFVPYAALVLSGAGPLSLPRAYAAAGLTSFAVCGVLMSRRGVTLGARDMVVGVAAAASLLGLAMIVGR